MVKNKSRKKELRNDNPFDTWTELYLGWIAAMFTVMVIVGLIYALK